jgi:hypothetical protein
MNRIFRTIGIALFLVGCSAAITPNPVVVPQKTLEQDGNFYNRNGQTQELVVVVSDSEVWSGIPPVNFQKTRTIPAGTIINNNVACLEMFVYHTDENGNTIKEKQVWMKLGTDEYVLVVDWRNEVYVTGVCQ